MKAFESSFLCAALLAASCFVPGSAASPPPSTRNVDPTEPQRAKTTDRSVWELVWDDKIDDSLDRQAKLCRLRLAFRRGKVTGCFDGPVLGLPREARFVGNIIHSGSASLLLMEQREKDYTCVYQMQAAGGGYFGVWHDSRGGKGDVELHLLVNGQEATETRQTVRRLPGWGTAIDPDSDCKFFVAEDALLIAVPGSARPHDLAAEIHTTNAPRVLQSVRGDFTLQVRVDGRFAPGDESTKPGRTGYNGAGIVAIADDKNVVTLARAVLQRPGEEAEPYANFEIRIAGQLQRIGFTGDHPLPKSGPVFLRLERRGSKFLGAVSADGVSWDVLDSKEIPLDWPQELQTGVIAISTSKDEFTPHFSNFQVVK